jgi:hypothetical protein
MEPLKVNDRIRVRTPSSGEAWHTCEGKAYTRECSPGDEGVITRWENDPRGGDLIIFSVTWDSGRSSRIDESCLETVPSEADLDAEALRLFGVVPPNSLNHCKTCTCTD